MRILVITWGLPYPLDSGARIHDFHLIRELSREATVVVASLTRFERDIPHELCRMCEAVVAFRAKPRSRSEHLRAMWRGWNAGRPVALHKQFFQQFATRIRQLINERRIDIVQIEQAELAGYVDAVPVPASVLKILSLHNLGWVQASRDIRLSLKSGLRGRALFNALTMRSWEPNFAERFDRCLVVSELDASRLRERNPRLPVSVIENGVDCNRLRALPEAVAGNDLLFVGKLDYPPNADAVLFFCAKILPLIRRSVPEARLVVVGREAPRAIQRLAQHNDLVLAGAAESVMPYYERARLSVVPLRGGSGTRLKILESMALGRPVVTTSIGCEGLEVRNGTELLVADEPHNFADSVLRLLCNQLIQRRLADNARKLVENRYDWRIVGHRLLDLYRHMLSERRGPADIRP